MMVHTFDSEIEPLTVDYKKKCFYFYDDGPKVFYFADNKPRNAQIGREIVIKIENAVRKEVNDPEADVVIRWVIGDKACVSITDQLHGDEAEALTDLVHYKRTLFNLRFENNTWEVVFEERQAYEATTVCYH